MTIIEVITVNDDGLALQSPIPPSASLFGIPVRARLEPGDQIAAIVKDHDGRVLGYIAQSEADRIRALPSAAEVDGYLVRFARMTTAQGGAE